MSNALWYIAARIGYIIAELDITPLFSMRGNEVKAESYFSQIKATSMLSTLVQDF
jgi:hypothetical protein